MEIRRLENSVPEFMDHTTNSICIHWYQLISESPSEPKPTAEINFHIHSTSGANSYWPIFVARVQWGRLKLQTRAREPGMHIAPKIEGQDVMDDDYRQFCRIAMCTTLAISGEHKCQSVSDPLQNHVEVAQGDEPALDDTWCERSMVKHPKQPHFLLVFCSTPPHEAMAAKTKKAWTCQCFTELLWLHDWRTSRAHANATYMSCVWSEYRELGDDKKTCEGEQKVISHLRNAASQHLLWQPVKLGVEAWTLWSCHTASTIKQPLQPILPLSRATRGMYSKAVQAVFL